MKLYPMKKTTYILSILILFSFLFAKLSAVPAYPYPMTVTQPDGTSLTVILKGDEFHHYHTTSDNHLIIKDENGVFNYATIDTNGKKIDTKVKARDAEKRSEKEKLFVKNLNNTISTDNFVETNRKSKAKRMVSSGATASRPSKFPRVGNPKSLVILVNFSDLSFVTHEPQKAFESLLNEKNYSANDGTGSAKDYFRDNSMGTFDPDFVVVGPYTLPNPYKFYGENENGEDKNAIQMIVDACKAANDNGINFSEYDTDSDGLVDNVFIFYAGFNEAENASENTVWPHRWGIYPTAIYRGGNYTGSVASVTFNGKRVEDYACTSELKGNSGTRMTGIGTFTHEFGHVLGLADMYATNNANHHTLSNWSIMDGGSYLNEGRTPPSYNAFERFQLGFHTPTLLTSAHNGMLTPLSVNNESYLISSSDTHNLNPVNPIPTEFFLLENRQKIGWDSYLPGHGMLIYRIYYNKNDWEYNEPNNDPARMGVDIIEADGIANDRTLSGDPFPGTRNITTHIPSLRNGKVLSTKSITDIREYEDAGAIIFQFAGGSGEAGIKVSGNFTEFSAQANAPSTPQQITIFGRNLDTDIKLSFSDNPYFEIKKSVDQEWNNNVVLTPNNSIVEPTTIQVRYAPTVPSFSSLYLNINSQPFDISPIPLIGKTAPTAIEASEINDKDFVANWEPVANTDGYYLTVNLLDKAEQEIPFVTEKWVTTTSDTLINLLPDNDYLYKVKAAKKTSTGTERLTDFSNEIKVRTSLYSNVIKVHTLPYINPKELRIEGLGNGTIKVFIPKEKVGDSEINVFNAMGQKIRSVSISIDDEVIEANYLPVPIENLPINVVLIIQHDKQRAKVIVN